MEQNSKNKLLNAPTKFVIAGFDGFVDSIIRVVNKRKSFDSYQPYDGISDFARAINAVAGKSGNFELVTERTKMGGNGTLMAAAMQEFNHKIDYIGALGYPDIEVEFLEFVKRCNSAHSLAAAARTDALEFDDGKLMLGKLQSLNKLDAASVLKEVGEDRLMTMVSRAELVIFNNWTMIPHMNSIMELFLKYISQVPKKPDIFVDLADPAKRSDEDLMSVLELMKAFSEVTTVVLSLNARESEIVGELLGVAHPDIKQRAKAIQEASGISTILIHPLEGAAAFGRHSKEAVWVDGPYTSKPVITTGAGDNFNAGFMNAWLADLPLTDCLTTGVFTSGFYVRKAASPDVEKLVEFMGDA
jgi:sugar/nucleoside kinase (ribokinase family)